jgi:hypothetical protein
MLAVSCNFTHPCVKYISTILLAVNACVSNSARESNNKKKKRVLVNILVDVNNNICIISQCNNKSFMGLVTNCRSLCCVFDFSRIKK